MTKIIALTTCAALLSSGTALADPTIGFGLNFTFGALQPDAGLGLRVFSNDRKDQVAGLVGIDYMFRSQNWRGSLGAAHMMNKSYIKLNGGCDFNSGDLSFGIGAGGRYEGPNPNNVGSYR